MWITENEVKVVVSIYLLLLIGSILLSLYSNHLSFKGRIIRIILIVLLPIIGIAISLLEGIIRYVRSKFNKKVVNV